MNNFKIEDFITKLPAQKLEKWYGKCKFCEVEVRYLRERVFFLKFLHYFRYETKLSPIKIVFNYKNN